MDRRYPRNLRVANCPIIGWVTDALARLLRLQMTAEDRAIVLIVVRSAREPSSKIVRVAVGVVVVVEVNRDRVTQTRCQASRNSGFTAATDGAEPIIVTCFIKGVVAL